MEQKRVTVSSLLTLALALALLSGLMQNAGRLMRRTVLGQPLDHGVHSWWLTPLGDSVLFFALALVLILLGRWFAWARRANVVISVTLFPLFLTMLFLLAPRLQIWARVLLALGVAVRLGTWASREQRIGRRVVSFSAWSLGTVTVLIAGPVALWPVVQEYRDVRSLPPSRSDAPNVLVLLWDTVRASSLSLYGHDLPTTPSLAAFARTGVVFDRAYGTASYTLPSHASLFTGRWAHELSATWRTPLDAESPTLAEVLASAGYRTGGFSANRIYVTREFGLGRGFAHFDEHRLGFQQVVRSSTLVRAIATSPWFRDLMGFNDDLARVHAPDNHRALLRWLKRDPSRPYFAFVNYTDAHTPYLPARRYAEQFGWYPAGATERERRETEALARVEPELQKPEIARRALRSYEAAIAGLDSDVAAMLDDLRGNGLLDNTVVVITSDHGEEFGEHGKFGHGNSLYAASLHVPLVVVFPGRIPVGSRVRTAVSIRDLPATILDLVGLSPQLPGSSLRTLWESSGSRLSYPVLAEIRHDPRLAAYSQASSGDMATAADDSVQVIRKGDGGIESFDLGSDPSGVTPADTLGAAVSKLRTFLPESHRLATRRVSPSRGGLQ